MAPKKPPPPMLDSNLVFLAPRYMRQRKALASRSRSSPPASRLRKPYIYGHLVTSTLSVTARRLQGSTSTTATHILLVGLRSAAIHILPAIIDSNYRNRTPNRSWRHVHGSAVHIHYHGHGHDPPMEINLRDYPYS